MELPLLSPPWFYRALSELALYKSKPYYGFCKAFPHKDRARAPPLEAKARGGEVWKITGASISSCRPEPWISHAWQENTRHEISYSSPPLWSVSQDISCSPAVFFLLYFHSITDKLAEKCRLGLLLEGVSAAEWCGESRPAQILWHNLPPHQIEKCE